nr:hypothetical protein BaRGS_029910 [Batillaria attramentaria]KAG5704460.1 hypothetical protein BaRGS_024315 [Batillaria attramentaria]
MAMAATLFVAQALHEFAIEQYEIQELCTVFAILIHFFWLASVMMMSVTTAHFFLAVVFPLRARTAFASRKVIWFSLAFALISSAALVGLTMLGNFFVHGDIGYPGDFICFIRRPRSRQLGFGLPLAIAVTFNLVLFLCTSVHIRRRPTLNSTCHERVSLSACFRLSVITGASWLSLFLLAIPGTRPWLEYACVVLVGLQGCMLAATLLATKRVMRLWQGCVQSVKTNGGSGSHRTRSTPPKRG